MIDCLWPDASSIDLKSSESANPRKLGRRFCDFGYDVQWGAYTSALRHCLPEFAGRESLDFLVFEPDCEFSSVVHVKLSPTFQELGERKWHRAVNIWAKCLAEDTWPGYSASTVYLEPPGWELSRFEEEELTDD
jgi:hypothetical protein